MPAAVKQRALRFASELGLSGDGALPDVLGELTRHFRSFEESDEPPDDTGDIYLDLCRGMRGVCRHRAYGFVITAHALGIPARFVMNEAHAWVEAKMPEVGWMRIDLGGAAQGLEAHNADQRPLYRPVNPDPLPRPLAYERSYSQAREQMQGLRADARTDDSGGTSGAGSTGSSGASEPGDANGFDEGPTSATGEPAPGEPPRSQLRVGVDRAHYEVFRGRALDVAGRVVAEGSGEGVPELRLEVLLVGDHEVLLGVTVSRELGYYRGTFGVPPDLDVGDYRLVVRTPGNQDFLPATAR